MTLKDLILKYEFDAIVPDLIEIESPVKDNLYAFKEAFDTLRRMPPGDAGGEQIVVSLVVETEEDGTVTERYLHASNCEGDFWESSLAKEVIIEADITDIRALAYILWHITFYGFTPEHEGFRHYETKNEYERKVSLLGYHQFCNYARIKRKKNPTNRDLLCSLSMKEWDIYHARKAHRNRAKRMRDARQDRQIEKYERMGKIQRLIDSIVTTSWDSDYADYNTSSTRRKSACLNSTRGRRAKRPGRSILSIISSNTSTKTCPNINVRTWSSPQEKSTESHSMKCIPSARPFTRVQA